MNVLINPIHVNVDVDSSSIKIGHFRFILSLSAFDTRAKEGKVAALEREKEEVLFFIIIKRLNKKFTCSSRWLSSCS